MVVVFVLTDELYMHTEHSMRQVIVRLTALASFDVRLVLQRRVPKRTKFPHAVQLCASHEFPKYISIYYKRSLFVDPAGRFVFSLRQLGSSERSVWVSMCAETIFAARSRKDGYSTSPVSSLRQQVFSRSAIVKKERHLSSFSSSSCRYSAID